MSRVFCLTITLLALAGCDNTQTAEAAEICKFEEKAAFYHCFEEKFPVGSKVVDAKQFLLESGFEHRVDKANPNEHFFVRSVGEMTSLKMSIRVSENGGLIGKIDGLRTFEQLGK